MASTSLSRIKPTFLLQSHIHPLRKPIQKTILQSHLLHTTASKHSQKPHDPSKPIVLEQPDQFRPPSHAARLNRRRKRLYYGKELSEQDRQELNSKQYPYAAPPVDSFAYRFLNNRILHVFIALSVLGTLYGYMKLIQFHTSNRFPELLPSNSLFFSHPIRCLKTYTQVIRMNMEASSREALDNMHRNSDDVKRRQEYRKAHGIPETTGTAAWLGLGTVEEDERRAKVEKERVERMEEERRVAREARERGEGKKNIFGIWSW